MDQSRATFQIVDSEVTMRPQVNITLLGESFSWLRCANMAGKIGLTRVQSGSRCSGKSTVLRQMDLWWSGSLCDVEERKEIRQVMLRNMIKQFNAVIERMSRAGIKYQREDSLVRQNWTYPSLFNNTEQSIATRPISQAC